LEDAEGAKAEAGRSTPVEASFLFPFWICIAWHGMALRGLEHFGGFLPLHPDALISLVSAVLVMSLFGIMKTGIVFAVALILDGKYTFLNLFVPLSNFQTGSFILPSPWRNS
jgi:hypothetical protein